MTHRIHIVGRKNSGKTTLVCDLVRELAARGAVTPLALPAGALPAAPVEPGEEPLDEDDS